jgi:hypothetical protein
MNFCKITNTIKGYLIIPLWIGFFIFTSIILVMLSINAWILQKIFGKNVSTEFKQRSIFPYEEN